MTNQRIHLHDEGAVASDGTIIRTSADYHAFLARMQAKRSQDGDGSDLTGEQESPLVDRVPSGADADDGHRLRGRALFRYRLTRDGKDPTTPMRDTAGNPLSTRAIFRRNLRDGAQ